MGCLKCGQDTKDGAVFCPECLESMDKYPVDPGVAVVIPQRAPVAPEKKVKRKKEEKAKHSNKKLTPAEKSNRQLRRIASWLFIMVIVLFVLLCGLAYMLFGAQDELQAIRDQQATTEATTQVTTEATKPTTTTPSSAATTPTDVSRETTAD